MVSEHRTNLEMAEVTLEERRLQIVLSRLLSRSSNVVDVGGHIGSFTSLARQFAPEGKHTIIEASATKANWLRRHFPDCRIEPVAVSDRIGTAMFHEDSDRPGYSKLSEESGPNRSEVKTVTLDSLNLGKVHLLKLDIEGAELAALRGATRLVEDRRPAIIFECGPEGNEGLDRGGLFEHVTKEMRYDILTFADFLYSKGPLGFDDFRKCGIYPFRAFNFVALPR
jgi:methyltransferase, FkbM family